jgi:ABC-type transporter Mla subunit MlaD
VIVTMSIDPDARLPEDPVVVLSPETMFGDWQAQISPRAAFPQYRYVEAADPSILPGIPSRIFPADCSGRRNSEQPEDAERRFESAFTEETAGNVRDAIQNIESVSAQLTSLIEKQQRTPMK